MVNAQLTDKDLIEAAAKAAGIALLDWRESWADYTGHAWRTKVRELWNPLTDDGDAFRLAVKLHLWGVMVRAHEEAGDSILSDAELCAATRRHIVEAAAGIANESW